ncbi:MAG: AAA family ATPase [Candidatus Woesearchaeota archaeon]|nr:AAA family ATPase [Candidatus Woesearchaeota archaeon]
MLLKSLKLNNIRSYVNQVIDFPTGSLLLSGDIGCGKSSILLAIEFVLFGSRRKHLSGSSLLRHGAKQGEVELAFEVDGKEIIIKRVLKRGKKDVSQETGFIVINGVKKEATAIELKSIIFDLMGYPSDLVTKSRDLIYRYTVYTAQEDMKQILLEDKDLRLDTLRKAFNIDKYKKIKENSLIFVRELKEKRKEGEGKISDLEEKKKGIELKNEEITKLEKNSLEIKPKLDKSKDELKLKKENLLKIEEEIKNFNELKKELELNELKLKNILEQRKSNKENIERFEEQIKELEKDTGIKDEVDVEGILGNIGEKEKQITLMETTIKEISVKVHEFMARKKYSGEIKEKILKLDECPTCEQNVDGSYKEKVVLREDGKLKELEENLKTHDGQHKEAESKILLLRKERDELRKKENEVKLIKLKLKNLAEKVKEKEDLLLLQDKIKKEVGGINVKKSELNGKIELLKDVEGEFVRLRKEVDDGMVEERKLELEFNSVAKEKETILKIVEMLGAEIKEKEDVKKGLVYLSQMQNWLEEHFVNLMGTIEKHVMLSIYHEFNEHFQQWFNILIEDEGINVKLDEEFTPFIEQNGYETSIANLSGGERTSVALAYRLALNKVINDIIGDIKTKDILILDEPTDGFSTEQLDKVRDVLDELNLKQTIIVSHESKIEGFVDNVIRVSKEEHVSNIMGP